jgi:CPA1 family monovalent cation:H+ antiporter
LAAALSIPLTTSAGAPVPGRDLVLLLATATIVISLVVQGSTLAPLVERAGVIRAEEDARHEQAIARLRLAEVGLEHLEQVSDLEAVPDVVIDRLRGGLQARLERTRARMDDDEPTSSTAASYRQLRRDLLAVEGAELTRLYESACSTWRTRASARGRRRSRYPPSSHAGASGRLLTRLFGVPR